MFSAGGYQVYRLQTKRLRSVSVGTSHTSVGEILLQSNAAHSPKKRFPFPFYVQIELRNWLNFLLFNLFPFLEIEYDRGDSFSFDLEPNGIPFGSKLWPQSHSVKFERKLKSIFVSPVGSRILPRKLWVWNIHPGMTQSNLAEFSIWKIFYLENFLFGEFAVWRISCSENFLFREYFM